MRAATSREETSQDPQRKKTWLRAVANRSSTSPVSSLNTRSSSTSAFTGTIAASEVLVTPSTRRSTSR